MEYGTELYPNKGPEQTRGIPNEVKEFGPPPIQTRQADTGKHISSAGGKEGTIPTSSTSLMGRELQ